MAADRTVFAFMEICGARHLTRVVLALMFNGWNLHDFTKARGNGMAQVP